MTGRGWVLAGLAQEATRNFLVFHEGSTGERGARTLGGDMLRYGDERRLFYLNLHHPYHLSGQDYELSLVFLAMKKAMADLELVRAG